MKHNGRTILLRLNSNIDRYQLEILANNCFGTTTIYTKHETLCINTEAECLCVIARPLLSNYYGNLYIKTDISNTNVCTLNFGFLTQPIIPTRLYTFNLTDAIYGLKLNGVLNFSLT